MDLSLIKTHINSSLTNSEIINIMYDNLTASQTKFLKLITLFNSVIFSDNREEDQLIGEDNDAYYQLTSEEEENARNIYDEIGLAGQEVSLTLSSGDVVQLEFDPEYRKVMQVRDETRKVLFDIDSNIIKCKALSCFSNASMTTQEILKNVVDSFDVNEVMLKVSDCVRNGTTSISEITSYVRSQLPNLSAAGLECLSNLTSSIGQGGIIGFVSYIKRLYSVLSTANADADNKIQFDTTDYVEKTFTVGILMSGLFSAIGAIVGTIVSIAAPIVGLVIAGAGFIVSKAVDFYETNLDVSKSHFNNNSDNLSYAVPIYQKTWDNNCDETIYPYLNNTSRILEYKTPGVIHNAWKNEDDSFAMLESRLDLGWRKWSRDLFTFSSEDGDYYFTFSRSTITGWKGIVASYMQNPEYYNQDRDITTETSEADLQTRVMMANSWRSLDLLVRFIRDYFDMMDYTLAPTEKVKVKVMDHNHANYLDEQDWLRGSGLLTYPIPGWSWVNSEIAGIDIPFTDSQQPFTWGIETYIFNELEYSASVSTGLFISALHVSPVPFLMGLDCTWATNVFDKPYWLTVEDQSTSLDFYLPGYSIVSKSNSYLTPPQYSRQSLILTAILSGVIIAATVAVTIVTTMAVRSKIRSSFARKYAEVEVNRETLKDAIKSGDESAIFNANKDYIKSVKRYNLASKIFGQSSLNFTDGWQSSDSAESLISKLTTTASSLKDDQLAFSRSDDAMYTISDVVRLIKPL